MDQRAGSSAVAAIVLLLSTWAGADELLLVAGRTVVGEVTFDGGVYSVRTEGGLVEIPASAVLRPRPGLDESDLLLEAAAEIDPNDPDAWFLLAERMDERGLPRAARGALDRCLALDPGHWSANERLGRVRSGGRWVEAGEYLEGQRVPAPTPGREELPPSGPERVRALARRLLEANERFRLAADAAARAEPLVDREDASRELVKVLRQDGDPDCRTLAAGAFGEAREIMGTKALVRNASADTLIVADGFSCQEQIAQLTGRRAIHLAQALRLALDVRT